MVPKCSLRSVDSIDVKKSICLVKIIMSKLHFANLSFDEKSSNTLRENEKYLKFCLINIYFFYINRIYRSQGTFWYFLICFKVTVDRATRSRTRCTAAKMKISVWEHAVPLHPPPPTRPVVFVFSLFYLNFLRFLKTKFWGHLHMAFCSLTEIE